MTTRWIPLNNPEPMKGHKLFKREASTTPRIYIADWSGTTPDTTDDGELWVDTERPAFVGVNRGPVASVPVINADGIHSRVLTTLRTLREIRDWHPIAITTHDDAVRDLLSLARFIDPQP